nr:unnamed protein product [Haemonchus contortus]
MASNKRFCSSRSTKDTTTGGQDNDFKDYAAIAGMPEDPAMRDARGPCNEEPAADDGKVYNCTAEDSIRPALEENRKIRLRCG